MASIDGAADRLSELVRDVLGLALVGLDLAPALHRTNNVGPRLEMKAVQFEELLVSLVADVGVHARHRRRATRQDVTARESTAADAVVGATKPPVAKCQVAAEPLGDLGGLPNLAGGDNLVDDAR